MSDHLPRGGCCANGIDPKAVYEFLLRAESEGLGLDSFQLIKDGAVVAEGYHAPYTADSPHILYSMSKAFTSLALGFAVDEGLLTMHDSVTMYFPEYDPHLRNRKVRISHLVTMTAGKLIGMAASRHGKDWISIFFDAPFFARPGKVFFYCNDNFYLISAIISIVSGQSLADFLYPRLFEPLGIKKPFWETDKYGYAAGGWGLYLPIDDMAKVWWCACNGGRWGDRQVIPAEYLQEATAYQVPTVRKGQVDVTMGYGYGFWRTRMPDTYRAYGLQGQFGYVTESKKTVLAVNAGIAQDHRLADAIADMYAHLWDEPHPEYEEPLAQLCAGLGDKDILPSAPRQWAQELRLSGVSLDTASSGFASMLHATVVTVMNSALGHTDRFRLRLDEDNRLYLHWREGGCENEILLGTDGEYAVSPVILDGMSFTACTKAAWLDRNHLKVYVRLRETCTVRRFLIDLTDRNAVIIKNDAYPDLPSLASYYMDFSGLPLPKALDALLTDVVAPAILLFGEPDFKISLKKADIIFK